MATPGKVKLKLHELDTDEGSFQHRRDGIDPHHVAELVKALKINKKPLDAIWVWRDPDTGRHTVLSGHHRLEAYRKAKWRRAVPVQVHACDKREAVLLSVEGNRKAHKPLTAQERSDIAWRLCCDGSYSRREIVSKTTVADGTVAKMRRIKKKLQEARADEGQEPNEVELPNGWWLAMREAKGLGGSEWTSESEDDMNNAKAQELDAKIGEEFGVSMHRYPKAAMMFLAQRMSQHRIDEFAEEYAEVIGYADDGGNGCEDAEEDVNDGDDQPF
jgi:ParB-like chromosome segregation protein Spo0J